MSATAAATLQGVRFGYGAGAFELEVANLELEPGERVACIGPSGSGKTTLLNLIAGNLVPHSGQVLLAGQRLDTQADRTRRARRIREIGMVFQEFELLEYLSALDNILLPYRVTQALELDESVRTRARQLAAASGVEHTLARPPRELSQGERQRIALCRALITQPALLLADEPTGNLDPESGRSVLDLVFEQVASQGASLFMVTHNHELLPRFDRVVDIRDLGGGGSR